MSNSPAATVTYIGTQSPGDVWDWTINSDTFSATNETSSYTCSGGKTSLPSGYLQLSVTDSTDPGVTLPTDVVRYRSVNTGLVKQ